MYNRAASFLSIVSLIIVFASCTEPNFPDTPFITFKDVRTRPLANKDSLIITITFRDGYGDLGLGPYDTVAPFDTEPYRYNYHITGYKRLGRNDQGEVNYVPVEFPTPGITFNGRFPVLKPDGKPGPIEGDLDYSIPIEFPQDFTNENYILPGDTLKFTIYIYDRDDRNPNPKDRKPNQSNIIETRDVVVLQR